MPKTTGKYRFEFSFSNPKKFGANVVLVSNSPQSRLGNAAFFVICLRFSKFKVPVNMSGLKVFVNLMSQPARAVVLFLKINSIPHEIKTVELRKGSYYSDVYQEKKNVMYNLCTCFHR